MFPQVALGGPLKSPVPLMARFETLRPLPVKGVRAAQPMVEPEPGIALPALRLIPVRSAAFFPFALCSGAVEVIPGRRSSPTVRGW
jgi:hypothetical protein